MFFGKGIDHLVQTHGDVCTKLLLDLDGSFGSRTLGEVFGYRAGWEFPSQEDAELVRAVMGGPGDLGEPARYVEP